MGERGAAAVTACALLAALVVLLVVVVPWRRPGRPPRAAQRSALDELQPEAVARGRALHATLRVPRYVGMAVELAVALLLGLTPAGAGLVAALGQLTGDRRLLTAVLGGLAVAALPWLASLPTVVRRRVVLRRYGLITQGWGGWLADLAKGGVLGLLLGAAALVAFFAVTGALPRLWWLPVAAAGALLAVLMSMVVPVLVEPLFHRFTPMPDTPLRAALLELAAADRVPVRAVLVADASRRTRAVNAYVSGLGPTRRVVVYDTLLDAAPDEEVRLVVAHELGHARYRDVLVLTAIMALSAALGACLLALIEAWHGLLRLPGVDGFGDPRSVGLLLAVLAVAQLAAVPAGNLVSRRIEARADEHALRSTGAVDTFAAMQRRLALRNLADVDPNRVEHLLFDSHPSTVERLAAARTWAA